MPSPTLGFLVDTLAEDYQRRVFAGLADEAVRLNVDAICFVGGALTALGSERHQNRVYECVGSERLDGLVIAGGTLGNQVSREALNSFMESFQPLPTCCLGVATPELPSVTVDNQAGMREALTHLINDVGRQRIAFIRGPEANREAEERFQVYREVIAEHHLSLDADLITMGTFEAASGADAVRTLIDERRMGFDAIVAASDLMALGALNALSERGVAVPERVSVVGFDDIEAARYATSPLTTVRQPLSDLGRRALSLVVEQANDVGTAHSIVLPARLVKRQSTATARDDRAPLDNLRMQHPPDSASFEHAYRNLRSDLFDELRQEITAAGLDHDWPEQLCNSFVSEASGRRTGLLKRSTLEYLEHLLLRVAEVDGDVNAFQKVISRMRIRLRPLVLGNLTIASQAEDLWHRCRVLVGGIAERYQVQNRLLVRHRRRSVARLGAELVRCESLSSFREIFSTGLANLGIPAAAVCLFKPAGMSKVVTAYDTTSAVEIPDAAFNQRTLLPGGLLGGTRRRTLLVETLYAHDRALGYVVFEMGPNEPEVYELLRDYLTGALRSLQPE